MSQLTLEQPISELHVFGKRLRAPLKRLQIATVRELLLHTPVRHEDLRTVVAIRDVQLGERVVVRGRIVEIASRRSFRRRMALTEALVSDATGSIRCVWFNQPYLVHAFKAGTAVILVGTATSERYGVQLASPVIERDQEPMLHAGRLVPVYALTAGMTQKQFRFLINTALPCIATFEESLPESVRARERLVDMQTAVRELHFPSSSEALGRARDRFAFEELFAHFLRVRASRNELAEARALIVPHDDAAANAFVRALPFPLTGAQERAASAILTDMGSTVVMQRLLNGDVGSGKTVVAAIAAASAARAGFQTAYLAPTEVLAVQQVRTFERLLRSHGVCVALWTRTTRRLNGNDVALRELAAAVRNGTAHVVIGTHAVLSASVRFRTLALAIIDEQHRFGVEQRAALRAKVSDGGHLPHLLSMTATPIPRTLSLTLFGDLDISVLDELPASRSPLQTFVIRRDDRFEMTRSAKQEIALGHQVFIVCPKIDGGPQAGDDEANGERAAVTEAYERAQRAFPGARIGMLHGRMAAAEQRSIMEAFDSRMLDVLVATTVIEVGVDQPNATVMVVEDAERFGLAQLHQLRGRVGRGTAAGTCYLATQSDHPMVLKRLEQVAQCRDGFSLAALDLAERGPGAVVGIAQSGWPEFRYATMDAESIARAQRAVLQYGDRVTVPDRAAHLE